MFWFWYYRLFQCKGGSKVRGAIVNEYNSMRTVAEHHSITKNFKNTDPHNFGSLGSIASRVFAITRQSIVLLNHVNTARVSGSCGVIRRPLTKGNILPYYRPAK